MSGSKIGGLKAAATNKERHGNDFYARIGAKGGSRSTPTGGFGADHERARIAGAKGGSISRRDEAKTWYEKNKHEIEYMRQDGFTMKEICSALGCSQQRIYYVLNKYGRK